MVRSNYDDQVENLLGNKEMPVLHQEWSVLNFLLNLAGFATFTVAALFAGYFLKIWIGHLREQSYRRSIRRKYGIPDDNNEPFNIAYAKILKERDDGQQHLGRKARTGDETRPTAHAGSMEDVANGKADGRALPRQRVVPPPTTGASASYSAEDSQHRPSGYSKTTGFRPVLTEDVFLVDEGRSEPADTRATGVPNAAASSHQQDENGIEPQTPHADRSDVIDLDGEDVSMEVNDEVETPPKPQRGSKRHAEAAGEAGTGNKSGKRARRQSQKPARGGSPLTEAMDIDHISRGKKRDRADTESNFGGEESFERRSRKTRRHGQHQSPNSIDYGTVTNGIRGLKRTLEAESTLDSAEEEDMSPGRYNASRKRGKHADVASGVVHIEPACGDRQIGDEWQVNGQTFKVGTDGRRLRQTLIKTRRSIFSMPKDSSHPDNEANLVVLVEKWLNDDEYKAAEERGDIFSPDQEETGFMEVVNSRTETGKRLVWSPKTLVSGTLRSGVNKTKTGGVAKLETPVRPLLNGHKKSEDSVESGKSTPVSLHSSPSIHLSRSFSKWEKQDFEAEAMSKLRQKLDVVKKSSPKKVSFEVSSEASSDANRNGPSTTATPVVPATKSTSAPPEPTPSAVASAPTPTPAPTTDSTKAKPAPFSFAPAQPSPLSQPPQTATPVPTAPHSFAPAFGDKTTSTNSVAPSTVPLINVVPPSSGPAPTAPTGNRSASPFGVNGATQVGNAQATAPPAPSSNSRTPSPFAAKPANVTSPFAIKQDGAAGPASQPTFAQAGGSGASTPAPSPFSFTSASKPSNEATAPASSNSAPKFSFGFGSESTSFPGPGAAPSAGEGSKAAPPAAASPFQYNAAPTSQPFGGAAPNSGSARQSPAANAPAFQQSQQAKFSFGTSQPSAAPSLTPNSFGATKAPSNTTSTSPFQFGMTQSGAGPSGPGPSASSNAGASPFGAAAKPAGQTSSPFGNLANGSSPFGVPANTTNNASSSTIQPASGASSSSSPFTFGAPASKPPGEAPKPLFGNAPSTTLSASQSQVPMPAASQPPKPAFSFNFGASPAATSTPSATSAAGTSSAQGSAPGMFSFGAPTQPQGGAAPPASSTPFTFGAGTGSSGLFGAANPIFGAQAEKK